MPEGAQLQQESADRAEQPSYVLNKIAGSLSFLADFIPADVQLLRVLEPDQPQPRLAVLAEARPSVRPSFYRRSHLGYVFPMDHLPAVARAWAEGEPVVG